MLPPKGGPGGSGGGGRLENQLANAGVGNTLQLAHLQEIMVEQVVNHLIQLTLLMQVVVAELLLSEVLKMVPKGGDGGAGAKQFINGTPTARDNGGRWWWSLYSRNTKVQQVQEQEEQVVEDQVDAVLEL